MRSNQRRNERRNERSKNRGGLPIRSGSSYDPRFDDSGRVITMANWQRAAAALATISMAMAKLVMQNGTPSAVRTLGYSGEKETRLSGVGYSNAATGWLTFSSCWIHASESIDSGMLVLSINLG